MLRNLCMYDRENPRLQIGSDSPTEETYCSITGNGGEPFAIADSNEDGRVHDHPARSTVMSYCGVPLLENDGSAFGTLCHFDLRPRVVPANEIPVMQLAAPLVLEAVTRTRSTRP